ncbi:CDC24 Calponin [Diplocarpon rosae]|nr:CDC24 Calponin [Diplocarpon rosae]
MAQSHGPLSRNNTAPAFNTRGAGNGMPGLGHTMNSLSLSSRSSQLSGSTAFTSSSSTSLSSMTSSATLVAHAAPPAQMTHNAGNVVATNNIINQRADASRSLYQICVNLRQRLATVPDFDAHLSDSNSEDEGEDMDPVSSLWRCLRKGTPLVTIYNSLKPPEPLGIDEKTPETKRAKSAAFKFVAACLKDLKLPPGECFSLQDLFGDDTTGFVKVTQVINIVLDIAEQKGNLLTSGGVDTTPAAAMAGKMSYRDHVVRELVDTERKYVQDLENLHELKKTIEEKGVIPGDVVHDIFLNINAILDFQRRFLIKIESTNYQADSDQKWGLPFSNSEEGFGIYQPFIANQRKAAAIAKKEFDKIALADHPVVVDFNTLDGFLLKPMQRLVKYPLLLKDLRDKTSADDETKADLNAGIESANRVLTQANSAVDRELRAEALEDLCARVDDWKLHRVEQFGELLQHGHFPVVTGKSDVQKEVRPLFSIYNLQSIRDLTKRKATLSSQQDSHTHPDDDWEGDLVSPIDPIFSETPVESPEDQQHHVEEDLEHFLHKMTFYEFSGVNYSNGVPSLARSFADKKGIICPHYEQYTIYLFERILLCCKEVNPNKSKDKLLGTQKDKKDKRDKNRKEPNKNAKLQLKGRIFMTNVTEVMSLAKQGSYSVQIFWKGDPGVENFIIRFSNEETMRKWYEGVDGQRKQHASTITGSSPEAPAADFAWMRDQAAPLPNPYAQQEDDDDEDEYSVPASAPIPNSTYSGPDPGMIRNGSNSSLRSRAKTGETGPSLAGIARAPPPRFPMGALQNPPLSLQTQLGAQMPSPGQRGGDSYFSPVAESPASSRISGSSQVFPFPRQGTPQSGWESADYNRYTAPAQSRAPSRGSQTPADAYQMNGRTPQRPSLPAMPHQSAQAAAAQRSRSYSTPDINAPQNGSRRLPNGLMSGPVPAVPGIPAHLHPAYDNGIPRSQNSSPNGLPTRTNTQSPGVQRERMLPGSQYPTAPQYPRSNTAQYSPNIQDGRAMSPPLNSAMSVDSDMGLPTQLKVKVNCDGNYVTLVVAFNITYQSLVDRIDAKVGRFSNNAIAAGTMRLRYRDEDGDFVTIESDDDIQIAFQEWREAQKQQYHQGQLGEIELFCLSLEN